MWTFWFFPANSKQKEGINLPSNSSYLHPHYRLSQEAVFYTAITIIRLFSVHEFYMHVNGLELDVIFNEFSECKTSVGAGGGGCRWGGVPHPRQDPQTGQAKVCLFHTLHSLTVQRESPR